jgi:hypothetical protein
VVRIPAGTTDFSSLGVPQIVSGTHPASSSVGISASMGDKRGFEVDHLHPSSAEVRNECSYTFTPPIYLHDEHRDNMTSIPTLNDITVHPAVRCMHPIFILLITLLTFGFFY